MKNCVKISFISLLFWLMFPLPGRGLEIKKHIFIISSYHPGYLWSQEANEGLCSALLGYNLFDNQDQIEEFKKNDYVETSRIILKKAWMDTKRKDSRADIANATARIVEEINAFHPDLILLGDDNAANYIGNQFIDTEIPIVFWGINGLPVQYGLIDSLEHPGHNVTGVYQSGYLVESVQILKKMVPSVESIGILSDDSETGRTKAKELQKLSDGGYLPARIVDSVVTNSYTQWKEGALRMQKKVDAFFIVNHNTLKDDDGRPVDQLEAGRWYLTNISKPECSNAKQFALEGILVVVDDSGFKQGFEAMRHGYQILYEGKKPSDIPIVAPAQGPVIVNRQRAKALGIDVENKEFIQEFVDKSLALDEEPK